MSVAFVLGAVAVLLLGWSLGAYNRLVRLRAGVISMFAPVGQRLEQAIDLLEQGAASTGDGVGTTEPDSGSTALAPASQAALSAAAAQLALSLKAARRQPLDAEAVAALKTAHATVHTVWLRHHGDTSAPAPATHVAVAQRAWEDHTRITRETIDNYNQSVLAYNAAIRQFPAVLLAYLFSFGLAECL